MRRLCSEKVERGDNLERTLGDKDNQIRELNAQLVQVRVEVERAYRQKEAELSEQLQQKGIKEYESTQTANKLQTQNNELKEQNIASQAIIGERDKILNEKNTEIKRKNDKLERWQEEVRRLEN